MNFLIWTQASQIARTGTPVRRYGWQDRWLIHTRGNVWKIIPHVTETDPALVTPKRVVQSWDFSYAEFLAEDWTDAAPEQNNVCVRPAPVTFVPPGVHLSAIDHGGGIRLIASLGTGQSSGSYWLRFQVNGVQVAVREATASGNLIVDVPRSDALYYECLLDVESALPLPEWSTQRRAEITFSAPPPLPETIALHFTIVGVGTFSRFLSGSGTPGWGWNIGSDEQDYYGQGYWGQSWGIAGWGLGVVRMTDGKWSVTFDYEDLRVTTSTRARSISDITTSPLGAHFPTVSQQTIWDENGDYGGPGYGDTYTFTDISVTLP